MNIYHSASRFSLWLLAPKQPVRFARHKPWVPKFRLIRQMQPWDGPPDMTSNQSATNYNETAAELRARLRKNGFLPPLIFQDRPINVGHTGQVTDPYVPPEGDGRTSLLSMKRLALESDSLLEKGKTFRETRRIRRHEPSFSPTTFVSEAESIYKEAHELLQNFSAHESRLFELVTEKALSEMTDGLRFRTLRWKFVSSVEPPRVVHVRTQELLSKDNLFAQVTVRFHTQQILAIYDRFGRLIYGNPVVPVDVLEYVVLEKHITDEYGIWRLHSKIPIPNAPPPVLIPTQRLSIQTESKTAVSLPAPTTAASSTQQNHELKHSDVDQ